MTSDHILIVEDDGITRLVASEMLSAFGVASDIARTGMEALQQLRDNPDKYAFILMDLTMPDLGGLEAVSRIRRSPNQTAATVPIIAFTGDTRFHDDARAAECGMNGYAKKPVAPGQLVALVDKYCSSDKED